MGDKIAARIAMREADVPTVPGTDGATTLEQARARRGGDRLPDDAEGVRRRRRARDAPRRRPGRPRGSRSQPASAEAAAAFGNGTLYLEKVLVPARHVEIQVLCDTHGNVLTLGERECSIQRRHQKLDRGVALGGADAGAARGDGGGGRARLPCGRVLNAGTFEFLLGPDGTFSFIELNARLQVEHPVTELCTGIDLVRGQLEVAAGAPLAVTGRAPRRGHAIEIRLNAEDPARDFMPAPGTVSAFRAPLGPGVRVDTFVEDGTTISPFYDSMIAKLIVWDADRPAAIARAERVLEELDDRGRVRRPASWRWRSCGARSSRSGSLLDIDARRAAGGDRMSQSCVQRPRPGTVTVPEARPRRDRRTGRRGRAGHPRAAPAGVDLDAGVVRLSVAARRGEPIFELAERAQEDVAEALRTMCGIEARVDVARGGARVTISRRQARRQALFLVYQWDLAEGEIGAQLRRPRSIRGRGSSPRRRLRQAADLDSRITAAVGGLDRRPAGRGRAQRAPRRDPRARPRRRPAGGRDRRGGRLREAVRVGGGGEARQRDPRTDPAGGGA